MKQYFKTVLMTLVVVFIFAWMPLTQSHAQTNRTTTGSSSTTSSGDKVQDGLNSIGDAFPETVVQKNGTFQDFAKKLIDYALYMAAILAVIFIIIGGYQYIFSAGADDKAKAGRKTLTNALIGLVIIVLSFVVVQVVYKFLIQTP